jgi:hydroxymethylglutaryl-CoA reductase
MTINDKDILVPMVVEEPSILAAVSNMSKLVRRAGGFRTSSTPSNMIGQIQLSHITDVDEIVELLKSNRDELFVKANAMVPNLIERGGGIRDIEFRVVEYDEPGEPHHSMVVVQFVMDCVDAMGANMINTVAENLAPSIESITGHAVNLRILSNYATERLAKAVCSIPFALLGPTEEAGHEIAKGIVDAYQFAYADPWRAATHNKGIMNGVDPVVIATGNDWRAIEAGAHAWAARSGQYRSLTKWKLEDSALIGSLEMPMQVGTVGGCIRNHPQVQSNLKLLGHPTARELAEIIVAVGLAQNLGALNALSTEGIQRGHMKMHARNIAVQAGANLEEVSQVVEILCRKHAFSVTEASLALDTIREQAAT